MWVGDLESNGLLEEATVVHCAVFINTETKEKKVFTPENIHLLIKWLDSLDIVSFHNGIAYDLPLLKKLYGFNYKGRIVDTLVLSRLLNPKREIPEGASSPHSVEAWGIRFGRHKPVHEDWTTFSPEMLHRCSEDVEIQCRIYAALMEEAKQLGGWLNNPYKPIDMSMKLFTILQEMGEYGWKFDVDFANKTLDRLDSISAAIERKIDPLLPYVTIIEEKQLNDVTYEDYLKNLFPTFTPSATPYSHVRKPFLKSGKLSGNVIKWMDNVGFNGRICGPFSRIQTRKINISSGDELKPFLMKLGWIPKDWNISKKTGQRMSPKLSGDDPFEGLVAGVGKMLAKRLVCRQRASLIRGYINAVRPDGRIPSVIYKVASTFRARHEVIVNIPSEKSFMGKEMRKMFISKPGYVIVGTDSAGCQNRMLCARVTDEMYTKALLEGKKEDKTSIHHINQANLAKAGYDVSYGDAKGINYACLFGASHAKLGKMVGGNAEDGKIVQDTIFGVAPGFQTLIDNLKSEWKRTAKRRINKYRKIEYYDGYVTGLDGRPILIDSEHKLLVYLLQSDEAIMMSAAMCKLYHDATKAFGPHGVRWGFLTWQHDEFQNEVEESIAEAFSKIAENSIVWAGKYYKIACPHQGDSAIGKNWYETH